MARPRKKIDPVQVVKLARIGCTDEEIGDIVGCSVDTLARRFAELLPRARALRKMSIRRAQTIRATRDRSDRMLIHLGIVELGQTSAARGDLDEILKRILRGDGREGADDPGEVS